MRWFFIFVYAVTCPSCSSPETRAWTRHFWHSGPTCPESGILPVFADCADSPAGQCRRTGRRRTGPWSADPVSGLAPRACYCCTGQTLTRPEPRRWESAPASCPIAAVHRGRRGGLDAARATRPSPRPGSCWAGRPPPKHNGTCSPVAGILAGAVREHDPLPHSYTEY